MVRRRITIILKRSRVFATILNQIAEHYRIYKYVMLLTMNVRIVTPYLDYMGTGPEMYSLLFPPRSAIGTYLNLKRTKLLEKIPTP